MIAAGIDLGGTKIETQLFDLDWKLIESQRVATPQNYDDLIDVLAKQVKWARARAEFDLPVGIGLPGILDKNSGKALTANLPATGRYFVDDITRHAGQNITFLNDCRALALSEAMFGAGQECYSVLSIIFGTGIGGGVAIEGHLWEGPNDASGEFGHSALPAHVVKEFDLPILPCGCGRHGCVETLLSGAGLSRLAKAMKGIEITAKDFMQERDDNPSLQHIWYVWCRLAAEVLHTLTLTIDPEIIILGGGLSKSPGIAKDLSHHLSQVQLPLLKTPNIEIAQGGDASGARGAAAAAFQETKFAGV